MTYYWPSGFVLGSPVGAPDTSRTYEGMIMSIKVKGRERSGLVLAAGTLLSSLGVVMVALVCCGVPVLTAAAGVFAAARAMAGNLWFIAAAALAAAALAAGALLLRAQRRGSPGTDCCARSRPGASLSAGSTPTPHSSSEQERSGQSRAGASEDAGSQG